MTAWLLDNSAWSRLPNPALPDERRLELGARLEHGRLHISLPFMLEAGVSARSEADWAQVSGDLDQLPQVWIDAVIERRTREAQSSLIAAGLHRSIPSIDLLLAAIAERHGLTLLHYDHDFDRIAGATDLAFAREWLAPPGSL